MKKIKNISAQRFTEREINLKRPYICVQSEKGTSFGGNQAWFPHSYLRNVGCGIVAATDFILYETFSGEIDREQYIKQASGLWKREIPVIPGFGVNGFFLVLGLNLHFFRKKMPFLASWQFYGRKMLSVIDRMLAEDLPVILAVGPNFPFPWKKERLTFYGEKPDGSFYPASSACAHFVTVTGRKGEMLAISSWGKKFFVKIGEYEDYVRQKSSPLVCGIVRMRKLKSKSNY